MALVIATAINARAEDPKSDEKKEEPPKVQLDPETQKKIDDLLAKEEAKKNQPAATPPAPTPAQPQPAQPEQPATGKKSARGRKGAEPATATNPVGAPGMPNRPDLNPPPVDPGASATVNIPPAEVMDSIPPEERMYKFSIKGGSYQDLIEGIAGQTGLGVIGEAPRDGLVNFTTDNDLTFEQMLDQVRMLFFNYKPLDPYTILRTPEGLKVIRVNDYLRHIPENRMFMTVDAFQALGLPKSELALVRFAPKSGSISDLRPVRDFLPDYFRVNPDETGNAVYLFGLVSDIEKYLRLKDLFASREDQDPRTIEKIPVIHMTPSEAVNKLSSLMDMTGQQKPAAMPKAPRGGAVPDGLDVMPPPQVSVFPDDAQGVIIVRAMRDKIAEIKQLLPLVDVETGTSFPPEVIAVHNADPAVLLSTIQQILAVGGGAPSAGAGVPPTVPPPTPGAPGGSKKKRAPRVATPVATETITLLPHPSGTAIIAIGGETEVAHVRDLVAKFDVKDITDPIRVPLQHCNAAEITTTLANLLAQGGAMKPAAQGGGPQFIADNSGCAMWYIGPEKVLEQTRELLTMLDVASDVPKLHRVRLQHQRASFVVSMLKEYEGASGGAVGPGVPVAPPTPDKPKRKRAATPTAVSKFTADEENNMLWVLCTDEEWRDYEGFIKQVDTPTADGELFKRLSVKNIPASDAIEQLRTVMGEESVHGNLQYIPSGSDILVIGASDADLAMMNTLLAELDRPVEIVTRRFEIKHVSPTELIPVIEKLVTGDSTSVQPAQPKRKPKKNQPVDGAPAPVVLPAAGGVATEELSILPWGSDTLIVRTSPTKMEQVAAIIAEYDIPDDATEMRVYENFPPTADLNSIANTLESVVSNSAQGRREEGHGPQFIPQPGSHKLIVYADAPAFEEIERLLKVLRSEDDVEIPEVAFIELKHADAEKLVNEIEPALQLRLRRLIEKGEIAEASQEDGTPPGAPDGKPSAGKTRKIIRPSSSSAATAGQRYHLAPAHGNQRIVVVAVPKVIEEVRQLVTMFDVQGGDAPVMRTVPLMYASPMEMGRAIREMMGSTPRVVQTKEGGKEAPMTSRIRSAEETMTIVEAPGSNALILHGPMADVDQATKWIEELDAKASQGREIKVYKLHHMDVEDLVDLVMNMLDTPQAAPGAAPRRPAKNGKGKAAEEEEEDPFSTSKTHVTSDLFVKADLIGNTMLVATSPAKIRQIDAIVAQMDPEDKESPFKPEKYLPKKVYKLNYADAWDAKGRLETILELYWDDPKSMPDVDYEEIDDEADFLIVKCADESKFPDIEELIKTYADQPKSEDIEKTRRVLAPPSGINAKEAAERLKNAFPELKIKLKDLADPNRQIEDDLGIERLKPPTKPVKSASAAASPCVFPRSFARELAALSIALADPKDDEAGNEDELSTDELVRKQAARMLQAHAGGDTKTGDKKSTESDTSGTEAKRPPLDEGEEPSITYDAERGILILEGRTIDVKDLEDTLDDIEKELEETGQVKPDIRIYRVRYIDLASAANIIEEMFNTPRQQRAAIEQAARMAQQQQQMIQRQQQQQQQQQGGRGQPGQEGDQAGGRGARAGQPNIQVPQVPQMPQTSVRVYPNPRDRTLILRADTSQYPAIMELLATIDQPQPINSHMKVFQLEKLNATEVEGVLKDMLGLDGAAQPARQNRRAGVQPGGGGDGGGVVGNQPLVGPGGNLPEQILDETLAGKLGIDTSHIKLSSNAEANTIIVMAPQAAIDYIGEIIRQLESHEAPPREQENFILQHAEPTEVAEFLGTFFEESSTMSRSIRRGTRDGQPTPGGSSRALNAPTFTPYPRLNMLSVQCTKEQLTEVKELIAQLDKPSPENDYKSVKLIYADAKQVADMLSSMYAGVGGGASRGARPGGATASSAVTPRFIGNEGDSIIQYSAPEAMRNMIEGKIRELDEEAGKRLRPREIMLTVATPSRVAKSIQEALGGGSTGGGRGGSGSRASRFTVTANDATKRLFVTTDDAMFAQVEDLAKKLDVKDEINVDLKVFPLKHAGAKRTLAVLQKMFQDYTTRLPADARGGLDAFSVEADEKTNSLIVLGGPAVFDFVEKSMKIIDTPFNAGDQPGLLQMTLVNSDAAEVAANVKTILSGKQLAAGETAPQIDANKSGNMIIAKGTQAQVDEIKKIIEQIEASAQPPLKTETITLKYAQAEEVAATVKRQFDEYFEALNKQQKLNAIPAPERMVVITPDANTNQIIVRASEKNLAIVKERTAALDQESVAGPGALSNKVIALKFADPNTVANIINEWGRAKLGTAAQGKTVALRDTVKATAESATQSVVVTASQANHTLIAELITSLDTIDPSQRQVAVLSIKNADPAAVSRALQQIYAQSGGRQGAAATSISEIQGSKAVLVKASGADMERIKQTVAELDSDELGPGTETRVVPIRNGDATEMQTAVAAAFGPAGAGGGRGSGANLFGGARVSVLAQSNALVLSGEKEQIAEIEAKILAMDVEAGKQSNQPSIIRLTHVRANQVLPTLQQMFSEQARQGGARSTQPPVMVPLQSGDGLIVRASPTDRAAIESAVAVLDTEVLGKEKAFRFVQVEQGVPVVQIAEKVQESVNESFRLGAGGGGGRGGEVPSVTLTPDARTNSIIVAGSAQLFDEAEEMIRMLAEAGPAGGVITAVYRPEKTKPEDLQRLIDELKRRAAGEEGSGGGRSRGGSRSTPSRR